MRLFKRGKKDPVTRQVKGDRVIRVQPGADQETGFPLDRKDKLETVYFRTEADRNLVMKADQLAYDLRKQAAS